MGPHNILEDSGYSDIVRTDTIIDWELALKLTRHKHPVKTVAEFHAKKDGQCFRLVVERHYPNRSSELLSALIESTEEVSEAQYLEATRGIEMHFQHKRW